ncbi:fratricide two-peptide bacteriocin subunit CibB [Streptococcus pneumoniae]|uniref:fratricide two-peptide bacteriocin subunit CibB n=1 Tax=Streptococcus pneumoniae TaxID=1313 RepID=UPI000765394D|nr:fratricide two-peptide bacteriocin subunit CibB [Streptococcus pneumoniae]TVW09297.1 fratricide two-peptide bacteriocin subunit CibB [Streptococcus pneumoniae]CVS46311.1 bacteriocin-type signal sequence domain-containing protein [Streptococcus pneumoniae]CVZ91334.1 bacteriocin-type signal sequence domain-containing protein [Streptococcus pneumoniae]
MMKDLNNYREISNKELQEIKGCFGVGVGIALFMAGYTIGKDLRKKFGKSC